MTLSNQMIQLTDKAAQRVKHLIEKGDSNVKGLRVGVKSSGCSVPIKSLSICEILFRLALAFASFSF